MIEYLALLAIKHKICTGLFVNINKRLAVRVCGLTMSLFNVGAAPTVSRVADNYCTFVSNDGKDTGAIFERSNDEIRIEVYKVNNNQPVGLNLVVWRHNQTEKKAFNKILKPGINLQPSDDEKNLLSAIHAEVKILQEKEKAAKRASKEPEKDRLLVGKQ